jgi:hypothetical protein
MDVDVDCRTAVRVFSIREMSDVFDSRASHDWRKQQSTAKR